MGYANRCLTPPWFGAYLHWLFLTAGLELRGPCGTKPLCLAYLCWVPSVHQCLLGRRQSQPLREGEGLRIARWLRAPKVVFCREIHGDPDSLAEEYSFCWQCLLSNCYCLHFCCVPSLCWMVIRGFHDGPPNQPRDNKKRARLSQESSEELDQFRVDSSAGSKSRTRNGRSI